MLPALLALLAVGDALHMSAVGTKPIARKKLGSSDLLVSDVCLGTMTWGKQNTLDEGVAQLDLAFDDYDINFLDTAEMYPVPTEPETQGATDRTIGAWLKKRGRRDDVVLASTIIGATSEAQLRENIDAYFLEDLSEGCLDAVADIYRRYRDPSKV